MSESDVDGKRWASRALVQMLIKESKNYESAAEIVSGSESVFSRYSRDIKKKIEAVEIERSVATSFELQTVLEDARHEIAGHAAWQKEVIEGLPKENDETGLTGPLRQAFTKAAKERESLLEEVQAVFEQYFTGQ